MRCLISIIVLLFFCSNLKAQVDEEIKGKPFYAKVELKSGEEYKGRVVSQSAEVLVLELKSGVEMKIRMEEVKRVEYMDSQEQGNLHQNLQATRYFFGPNGFALKRGEGYYQNTWIFYNQASYGVTDNITIGGGMVPLFLFAGTATPVWITPKVSFPIKKDALNVGVGGLFGTVIGEQEANFGIGYGTFTLGNRDYNLNVSIGYAMAAGQWSSQPVYSVSGMVRTGPKFYLISENYFFSGDSGALLSVGGRSLFEGISLDYAVMIPRFSGLDEFIGIPWLGFTIPFRAGR